MQLYEKHRPKTLADIAGNKPVVSTLQRLFASSDWDRDAIWIEGPSGTGKTTLANIIARAKCDADDIHEISGADCTLECVQDIAQTSSLSCWGLGWKCFVINEANAMSAKAVQAWKTLLEPMKAQRLFIFTSARPIDSLFETGSENKQLASRCKVLTLQTDIEAVASRLADIAKIEGIEATLDDCRIIAVQCEGNYRASLQKLECFAPLDAVEPELHDVPFVIPAVEGMTEAWSITRKEYEAALSTPPMPESAPVAKVITRNTPKPPRPYFTLKTVELEAQANTDLSGVLHELSFRKSNAAKKLLASLTVTKGE